MTMSSEKFKSVIERVFGRYNKRLPVQSVQDDAWRDIKHVPDEAVDWIVTRLTSLEFMPSNWVRDFRSLWTSWRAAHPDRCARDTGTRSCPHCDEGELFAVKVSGKSAWDVCCPCGHCRIAVAGSKTTDQLERMGLIVLGTALKARAYVQEHVHAHKGIVRSKRSGMFEFVKALQARQAA